MWKKWHMCPRMQSHENSGGAVGAMLIQFRRSGSPAAEGNSRPARARRIGALLAVLAGACLILPTGTASAAGTAPAAGAGSSTQTVAPVFSYDLVTALGDVYPFGGAGYYGGESWRHLAAPIVGMAVTPDGRGYWLVGANGSVYNLGDARWYGSLASQVLGVGQRVIGMAATSNGKGYWLINASGAAIAFGDATAINAGQQLPAIDRATPIVSGAVAPSGGGAWFTDSTGHVYVVGDAVWYGSRAAFTDPAPFTSIALIPSGLGYWLADGAGNVWGYGGATPGKMATQRLGAPLVGSIPAGSESGYWATTSTGAIIDGGDAITRPGNAEPGDITAVVGIATATQIDPPPLPAGSVGYDINWPQCASSGSSKAGTLPGPPGDAAGSTAYSVAVVGVDGWAAGDDNPCLAPETDWAEEAVYPSGHGTGEPPYDLYMFLNSPAYNSTIDLTGPAGTCDDFSGNTWATCLAYNYGYNAAVAAVRYATAQGADASVWWLDIENAVCAPGLWSDAPDGQWWSCDLSLTAATIQGSLDALRSLNITPGIYSSAVQWEGITKDYMPTGGAPLLWLAGATWTSPPYPRSFGFPGPSVDSTFCTDAKYRFAGGTPVLLQETPGAGNNYIFDPDISC